MTFPDPSQNDEADTIASAYSVRPFHIPTVSTPMEWKEVKPGLDPGKGFRSRTRETGFGPHFGLGSLRGPRAGARGVVFQGSDR